MWSKHKKFNFEYIEQDKKNNNCAIDYARTLIKSDFNKTILDDEFSKIFNNECIYLKNFFCKKDDYEIFNKLKQELNINNNLIMWSKHKKCENPKISETFNNIIKKLSEHFKFEVSEVRLNYYENGEDWKPFHKDRHANGYVLENFTVGASFGSTRLLEFKHEKTNNTFNFPQNNGDVFAFSKDINKTFLHGIPKDKKRCGDRISIIAWGVINE